ncbi:MAG: hypothetical protein RI897_1288 [Verrucomicrobiota bacterium]|jgi:glycosyltransferase involved in cell wall biosynthesis
MPPPPAQHRTLTIIQVFNRYIQASGEERSVARIADDLESGGHRVHRFWKSSADWKKPDAPARWKQPLLLWQNTPVLAELEQLQHESQADLWLLHNVIPVVSIGIYRVASQLRTPIIQWLHNYRPTSPGGELSIQGTPLHPRDPWRTWKECLAGTWHGRILTTWLALGYRRLKAQGHFESVRAWVAVSEQMRSVFQECNWFPDRLHAVRHSWHSQPVIAPQPDQGHFLFLGRMVEAKGVRFIVDLWRHPQLRGKRLIMAGEGPLVDELRNTSPPGVEWVGFVNGEEKDRLLRTCRAVVFPSLWQEPLSTVAYEAYERCRPILASKGGGMTEIVMDRSTGRLLQPGNQDEWLQAIHTLSPEEAATWGEQGRNWLVQNVGADQWVQAFNHVAQLSIR